MHLDPRKPHVRPLWSAIALAAVLAIPLAAGPGAAALANIATEGQGAKDPANSGDDQDAIVGSWSGQGTKADSDPFDVRLTFVSPRGGVSRYPGDGECGGVLSGKRDGDHYQYDEKITFGNSDDGGTCVDGIMRVSVDGDTLKYEWSAEPDSEKETGELHREGGSRGE